MKKISLCVPAYNRVDTIKELINSFDKQIYQNKELVISDDSTNDDLYNFISKINRKDITYSKNKHNIGFTENLKKSYLLANGDYIVTLGDDDVLLKPNALSIYIDAFEKNKDIGFVYSNQVQFNEDYEIEYEINMFSKSQYYPKGQETFKKLWLYSIFIGGLAFKNDKKNINNFFPKKKILHPQVFFVGNLLLNFGAYTISNNLIGFRSRKSQFIFRALGNKKERQSGKHQNTELYEILGQINKLNSIKIDSDFIFTRLIKDAPILYPKEKMILGNKILTQNHTSFLKVSEPAKNSNRLKVIYYLTLISPSWLIFFLRLLIFNLVKINNRKKFAKYKLLLMSSIK